MRGPFGFCMLLSYLATAFLAAGFLAEGFAEALLAAGFLAAAVVLTGAFLAATERVSPGLWGWPPWVEWNA